MTIGELARRTGVKATTIRWYEGVGILPPPDRSRGGHRLYGPTHLARLTFLWRARQLGIPLDEIRTLLALADHSIRDRAKVHAVASARLADVERRLHRLAEFRDELERTVAACAGRGSKRARSSSCRSASPTAPPIPAAPEERQEQPTDGLMTRVP
ncbi:MerR family transcriptional regulator [Falsiroseomonas tokyonensis]|uniref:MerR family transcriptional regulator n=1 Tax=Falsiroseomonas tokyonensis TaxID=430521 RepID=A0ABV7C1W2_9PROT|nr:MerR family transcriptional regulator [Falsiroseomonas tokyonensis]MBU8541865.1 MerR family transcriptional regulator [Falsiroseomonas tokyonensis]